MPLPILTTEHLIQRAEEINSAERKALRQEEFQRWLMMNGAVKQVTEKAIRKEFVNPETVEQLFARIIPLNITQKIIQKLANVYNENPLRKPSEKNEDDQDLLELLEDKMRANQRQKENNQYFKLYKRGLQEIYIDEMGWPGIRNLPRHTYEVFSSSPTCPEIPDEIYKIIKDGHDRRDQVLAVWTASEHKIIDGHGVVLGQEMAKMENPDGINPFGELPFTYTAESTFSVDPIPDDDLLRMSIVIPLLLSDLAFAVKYLSWSVVYTIGAKGDIPFSPNSIIHLDFAEDGQTPKIDTVSPDVKVQDVLDFVEFLVRTLLSTKSLSSDAISGRMEASRGAVSGVSRALDAAESQEDKKDQQEFFRIQENQLWNKIAHVMWPVWKKNKELNPEVIGTEFSADFDLTITFREPKVLVSERDQIELLAMKIKEGFTTMRRVLQELNPDMDSDEIDELIEEIQEEKMSRFNMMLDRSMPGESTGHSHKGTGPSVNDTQKEGLHYHLMADGSGKTSSEKEGPNHTHITPDGKNTGGPNDQEKEE